MQLVMECTDKHEKKELISHLGIISEQMVTAISSRELTAFFHNTPLLPILQYFLVLHISYRGFFMVFVEKWLNISIYSS